MPEKPINDLLREIRGVLTLHRSLGITGYHLTPTLAGFLKSAPAATPGDLPQTGSQRPGLKTDRRAANDLLAELKAELNDCHRCQLRQKDSRPAFGSGNGEALLFIVGEWPGTYDKEADTLLTKMLKAIDMAAEEVFITNIVKCPAAASCQPGPVEIGNCLPFLYRQISIVAPTVICAMGPVASQVLLGTDEPLLRLRGRFRYPRLPDGSRIPLMPTFHPDYLLKNPEMKKAAWLDLQLMQKKLRSG